MKLFQKVKEIRSKDGVLHFTRFAIIKTKWFGIYIHKIYQADKDPFCHNHPWKFFGIVLKGGYIERRQWTQDDPEWYELESDEYTDNTRMPFSVSYGDRKYYHKILNLLKPTTTLFFTFGKSQEWGYMTNEGYVDSKEYRNNKEHYNETAKSRN